MNRLLFLCLFISAIGFRLTSEEVEIVIVNKTGFPLYEVYLAPQESSDWGKDVFPYDVILQDSYGVIIMDEEALDGLYKIRLMDEDGEVYLKNNLDLKERNKILILPKDLLALSPGEGLTFTLINKTGDTITGLYISSETEESWGDNLLDGYFLNGSEQVVELQSDYDSAFYDIRFDMRENSYIQKHVFLAHRARILLSLQ